MYNHACLCSICMTSPAKHDVNASFSAIGQKGSVNFLTGKTLALLVQFCHMTYLWL